jgi:hypothetical protein
MNSKARKLYWLRTTDKEIADYFGISEQTVNACVSFLSPHVRVKVDAEVDSKLFWPMRQNGHDGRRLH